MTKTFCPLPFNHLYVKPNGSYLPCCRFRNWKVVEKLNEYETLDDVLNQSQWLQDIRRQMLLGERVKGCESCYLEEETSGSSMRTSEIDNWGDIDTIDTSNPTVTNIEITFGNYCNLACRTCNSSLSTSWKEEDIILTKLYEDRILEENRLSVKKEWNTQDFKNVTKLKITGGEPMLHPDFLSFLDSIIDSGVSSRMEVQIFTNASFVPKQHLLDRLNKFKEMGIWLSIDGLYEVQNYVRHLSKWEIVEKSATTWFKFEKDNRPNVLINLAPTVSLYNIFQLEELLSWFIALRDRILDNPTYSNNCSWNVTTWPQYLDVKYLPKKEKLIYNLTKYKYKLNKNHDKFHSYVEILDRTINRLQTKTKENKIIEFVQYNKDLDKLRNQKFIETFPELYEQIKDIWDKTDGKLDK